MPVVAGVRFLPDSGAVLWPPEAAEGAAESVPFAGWLEGLSVELTGLRGLSVRDPSSLFVFCPDGLEFFPGDDSSPPNEARVTATGGVGSSNSSSVKDAPVYFPDLATGIHSFLGESQQVLQVLRSLPVLEPREDVQTCNQLRVGHRGSDVARNPFVPG